MSCVNLCPIYQSCRAFTFALVMLSWMSCIMNIIVTHINVIRLYHVFQLRRNRGRGRRSLPPVIKSIHFDSRFFPMKNTFRDNFQWRRAQGVITPTFQKYPFWPPNFSLMISFSSSWTGCRGFRDRFLSRRNLGGAGVTTCLQYDRLSQQQLSFLFQTWDTVSLLYTSLRLCLH